MAFVSDITHFIEEYKKNHPDAEKKQLEGRARLWDKEQDPELAAEFKQARVYQKPYVYEAN